MRGAQEGCGGSARGVRRVRKRGAEGPQEKKERTFQDAFSLRFSRSGTKALERQRLSADVKRGSFNVLSFFSCCFSGIAYIECCLL